MEQIANQSADVGGGLQGGHFDLILFRFHFLRRFALDGFLELLDVSETRREDGKKLMQNDSIEHPMILLWMIALSGIM